MPIQPTEPAGRTPAQRRTGAIAALTGVAALLHVALLSEMRWTWPTPPAPFGSVQVRALAAAPRPEPERSVADTSALPRDRESRSAELSMATAQGSATAVPPALRVAGVRPANERLQVNAARQAIVAAPKPQRVDQIASAGDVASTEAESAAVSDRPGALAVANSSAIDPNAVVSTSTAEAPAVNAPSTAPVQASASAWPEPDSIPLYRIRMPPPATLGFAMRVGSADGTAELRWRPEGETYGLRFEGRVDGGPTLTQASDGGFDGAGLAPVRHTDARTRRGMLATNFQREAGRISFSGSRAQVALARGSQDRLSWMVQLAAVLAAEPALRRPGAVVSIPVAGLRGEAAVWRFRAVEPEVVALAPASQPLVHLLRDRQGPYDVDIAVALDPARHYLPATLSLRTANGSPVLELVLLGAAFEP